MDIITDITRIGSNWNLIFNNRIIGGMTMNQFADGYNIEQNQAKREIIEKLTFYKETYGTNELQKLIEKFLTKE
jgi:hypothetical protein